MTAAVFGGKAMKECCDYRLHQDVPPATVNTNNPKSSLPGHT